MSRQASLFGGQRLQMTQSIQMTIDSLNEYGPRHKHWAVAWSGGKDSTALLTLLVYLLVSGKVRRPQTLQVFYADTRLELQPLWLVAADVRDELRERGIERPGVDLLNAEEVERINELIAQGTWPEGWSGTEPRADELLDKVYQDGSVQPLLDMFGGPR